MKTKEVTQYICDHCNKKYLRAHACLAHESMCHYNPENKTCCYGCEFLEKIEAVTLVRMSDYYDEVKRKVFHCKKKEVFLHPPQYKDYHYDLVEDNVTMPIECSELSYPF